MARKTWTEVDLDGFAKTYGDRPKVTLFYELYQNVADENATFCKITAEMLPNRPICKVVVEDDSPEGFRQLSDAWTFFAESYKKDKPEKAGRFNLGEKIVLAHCIEATITTTTGSVKFDESGRRTLRKKREKGSCFEGLLRITRNEFVQVKNDITKLIPRENLSLTFNDVQIKQRNPIKTLELTLPTIYVDEEGYLKNTQRKTTVEIFEYLFNEEASIYELGIPVVTTGDKWHYNIKQKVPLNMNRDNVTPKYLASLRVAVLNAMHKAINENESADKWVRDATSDERCDKKAFENVLYKRYGQHVITDPARPESNKAAYSAGTTVLSGRMLSSGEWKNLKNYKSSTLSSVQFPSGGAYSDDPDAPVVKAVPEDKYTEGMKRIVKYTNAIAPHLIDAPVQVRIVNTTNNFSAAFIKNFGLLDFNLFRLGKKWFDQNPTSEEVEYLILHELAHHFESDHLSHKYHEWCCRLGSRLKNLYIHKPHLFEL